MVCCTPIFGIEIAPIRVRELPPLAFAATVVVVSSGRVVVVDVVDVVVDVVVVASVVATVVST
jgi:hypothetical protein